MAGGGSARTGARARGTGGGDPGARPRLLASATELFNRKGYAGATVREIVAAAGVTKPVLYYYFRNKEGIFLDLMREAWSQFDALLELSGRESGGARERLKTLADRTLSLFVAHLDVARLIYSIYYGPPQGAPAFDMDAYHVRFQDAVVRMVRDGIRQGEFRKGSAEEMAWAVIGAINVAMELHLCHPGRALGRRGLERVLDLVFAGIAADGQRTRPAGTKGRKDAGTGGAR
ncbi:MAG: TetR/AcrR family transcriptional regulator [Gemmatimonadota bacterium]